jgi:hypothetical protein
MLPAVLGAPAATIVGDRIADAFKAFQATRSEEVPDPPGATDVDLGKDDDSPSRGSGDAAGHLVMPPRINAAPRAREAPAGSARDGSRDECRARPKSRCKARALVRDLRGIR